MSAINVLGIELSSGLPAEFFKLNRGRLRELFGGTAPIVITGNRLIQKSADATHKFVQDSNFWYLTGIDQPGYTLVLEVDKEYLVSPKVDPVHEVFTGSVDASEITNISGIETIYNNDEGWRLLTKRLSKVKHVATLQPNAKYIEQLHMFSDPSRAALVKSIKDINADVDLIDIRTVLRSMRQVKTEDEIGQIRNAVASTRQVYKKIEKVWRKADYENEIHAELVRELALLQTEVAYDPVIASGKNALTLHYQKNNQAIDKSKFLLLDIGTKSGAYCSDITRTVTDEPSKRQIQLYDAVLSVQEFAISELKPGVTMLSYEESVLQFMGEKLRELGLIRIISKESIREFYPHSSSHFLGIDTHDPGDYEMPLVPGMVLTVEPGIYIQKEGEGVRIEDDILITDSGCENLSLSITKSAESLA